jgi:hypothetical protein
MWLTQKIPRVDPRGLNNILLISLDGSFLPNEFILRKSYTGLNGYGFLLRFVTLIYPKWCYDGPGLPFQFFAGDITIEISAHNMDLQSYPVPSREMTLPANDGKDFSVAHWAGGADKTGLPANNLGSKKMINHLFPFGDSIVIKLTRDTTNFLDATTHDPAHRFFLTLHGYNCPEEESKVW